MTEMSERDKLFEHEYDGIREYDNPLPGWWVFLFWASIVFSVFYFIYYQFGHGESETAQYERSMLAHYALLAEQITKAGPITDDTIRGFQDKPDMMAAAANLFQGKCAVCHGTQGQGNIGPNLTDDFWLHGGRPTDLYRVISDGVVEKGMISWKTQLGLGDMLALAAYVGTLHGTNPPNAKAPQGEKVDPAALAAATAPAPETPGTEAAPSAVGANP
jgi:cytochrome c oxidase cbb3-type subunit 3